MLWNIGVFAANVNIFIKEFSIYAPKIYSQMLQFFEQKISYQDIEKDSIDFAVLEKSKKVSVIPGDFAWYDVGNLDVFLSLQNKLAKESIRIVNVGGKNNLARLLPKKNSKSKIIAFVGVSDLCLVEEKDVILVAKRSDVEKVKEVLKQIKKDSMENFL